MYTGCIGSPADATTSPLFISLLLTQTLVLNFLSRKANDYEFVKLLIPA